MPVGVGSGSGSAAGVTRFAVGVAFWATFGCAGCGCAGFTCATFGAAGCCVTCGCAAGACGFATARLRRLSDGSWLLCRHRETRRAALPRNDDAVADLQAMIEADIVGLRDRHRGQLIVAASE